MLTEEECKKALNSLYKVADKLVLNHDVFIGSYDILKNLIEEHFSNPPLRFNELKEGMWIWDNYWEEYFEISEVYSNTKEIDVLIHQNKINQKRYETIKYTPNRFYRKEVQE